MWKTCGKVVNNIKSFSHCRSVNVENFNSFPHFLLEFSTKKMRLCGKVLIVGECKRVGGSICKHYINHMREVD